MSCARAAVMIALLAAISTFATAQDGPAAKREQKQIDGYSLDYERGLSWEEGEQRIFLFSGSVTLTGPEVTLRADRLLVWTKLSDPQLKLREIYLEGNVVSRRKDPKTQKETVMRAERLYYDFKNHRACVMDLDSKLNMARLKTPVIMKAREAQENGLGKWIAKDVVVTTCDYGVPHYQVHLDKAHLNGVGKPRVAENPYDLWPYDEWAVRGEGITADIFGMSIFFWPVVAFGSAVAEFPLKSLKGGQSTRYGYWGESYWGVTIPKKWVDAITPFGRPAVEGDSTKWGEVNWEIDWRRKRGWAGGLDLKWQWDGYEGYVDTYYLHDQGGDPNIPFDAQFLQPGEPPLIHPDRGRLRLFHRQEVAPGWRLELEASYLSDRNLLPEFFPLEFKEGKEQETAAYVRWLHDAMGGYVEARPRLNDFQTQEEFLPRARYFLYDQPIDYGISWTAHVDAAHLRVRFDEDLHLPMEEAYRLDLMNELSRPVDLHIATAAPFLRARETLYDRDIDGDRAGRFIGTAGLRVSTQLTGVHDVSWEDIGLRRLRHIAQLEGTYGTNFVSTLEPSKLVAFDETDRLDEFEEVSITMRHRLQTKVWSGDELVTQEFLSVGGTIEYYPKSFRDTGLLKTDNFEQPFNWVTLAPHDNTLAIGPRLWSNLHWDARVQPRNIFAVVAAGEYNPVHRQEEVRRYSVQFDPSQTFSASVGEVFVKDVTTAFEVGLKWQITEKWRVESSGQYDFALGQFLKWRASLARDFHDFNVEVVAEVDEQRDERKFYVTAFPKFIRKPAEGQHLEEKEKP